MKENLPENKDVDLVYLLRTLKEKYKLLLILTLGLGFALFALIQVFVQDSYKLYTDAYSSSIETELIKNKIDKLRLLIDYKEYDKLSSELGFSLEEAMLLGSISCKVSEINQIHTLHLELEAKDSNVCKLALAGIKNMVLSDAVFIGLDKSKKENLDFEYQTIDERIKSLMQKQEGDIVFQSDDVSALVKHRSQLLEKIESYATFDYYNLQVQVLNHLSLAKRIVLSIFGGFSIACFLVILGRLGTLI